MAHLQDLMQSIRDLSDGTVWSRGVELARAETVQGVATRKGELELKVLDPKRLVPATVQFFLADGDWSCDCNSKAPACEHVAAAVIATHQARQKGRALPAAAVVTAEPESKGGEARVPARGQPAHIRYLFERTPQGLSLSRSLVQGGRVVPLEGSLTTLLQSGDPLAKLAATQDDLQIDLILGTRTQGVLGRELAAKVLAAMRRVDDVRLHDDRVEVVAAITGLAAVVEDCADGLRARLEQQRGIHEIFPNGIARMHKTLAPLREHGLVARDYEELRRGRIFRPHEYPELVTRLLPELEATMPVERRAKNLPRVEHHLPRLLLETSRDGNDLTVVPLLVYGDPPVARVDGDRLTCFGDVVPPRDLPAERRLKAMLENELGLAPGMRARYPMLQAIEATRRIQRFDAEVTGGGTEGFYVADALTPEFKVKDNGEFELRFESLVGPGNERGGKSDAAAVLQAWRNNEPLVPLLEGGFAPLPHDWLVQYGSIVTDLLAARAASAELPDASLTDLGRLCDALGEPIPRPVRIQRNALSAPLEKPKLPRGLKAKLRVYQATGVAWLQRLTKAGLGALLADDMGLGKTLQAITVLHGRALVVAPTSVLFNWASELQRFRPNLDICLYHGPRRHLDRDADVVLTSYALLRLDQETLAAKPWDMVVLDEAQAIKNPDSQVARAAYALEAECRLALTGTPVENRLEELWSEMHFLNPGLLGTRADFEDRYSKPIERGEPGIAPRLAERVRPFVLRRLKREVAPELPPRTDLVLRCELGPDERRTYDAMAAAAKKEVAERLRAGGNVLEALELLLRLRQAACHPALLPGQKADTSSKVDLLLENLDEAVSEGHKALVFSQWTSFLDLVEPHLTKAKIGFTRLDGSTNDRGAVVSAFQAPDGPPVLLLSLKAGGTGLNLTAADHVFMLDPWWNPAVEDQAADRAHRIGQDKPVFVHRLVSADTVEERILMLQEKKRALAESVHSGDAALKIGKEEILALFE